MLLLVLLWLVCFSSCRPQLSFGKVALSQSIDPKDNSPVDTESNFSAESDRIYASIYYRGAKGGDSYRFRWLNTTTGETVADDSLRYNEGYRGYAEGYAVSYIDPVEEVELIPPGDYRVEFYHNKGLVSTAQLTVSKPKVVILEVSLASQVNAHMEPVKSNHVFEKGERVYACVKLNYLIYGARLSAKWYSPGGICLKETSVELEEDYYEPAYIAFGFDLGEGKAASGKYKVEIYLDSQKKESCDFEVLSLNSISQNPDELGASNCSCCNCLWGYTTLFKYGQKGIF